MFTTEAGEPIHLPTATDALHLIAEPIELPPIRLDCIPGTPASASTRPLGWRGPASLFLLASKFVPAAAYKREPEEHARTQLAIALNLIQNHWSPGTERPL